MKIYVSIVVPVYNAEKYLSRCLDGLVNQTYPDTEIILVNDGSTDGSLEVCQKYRKIHPNIKIIDQKNQGVSCARNAGMDAAQGKYICFADADDAVEENFIESLVQGIEDKADLAVCGHDKICPHKVMRCVPRYNRSWNKQQLQYRLFADTRFMVCYDKIYRSEILKRYGIRFVEHLKMSEDALFEMEYALHCQKAAYIPAVLYHYIQNDDSVTHKADRKKILQEYLKFWNAYLNLETKIDHQQAAAKDAYRLRKFYEAMGIVRLCGEEKEDIPDTVKSCYQTDAWHFMRSPHVKCRYKFKYLALKMGVLKFFSK